MSSSKCRSGNPVGFRFCGACGQPLEEGATRETSPNRKASAASDRFVHRPFGYTAMCERLDPEDVQEVMSRILGEILGGPPTYRMAEGYLKRAREALATVEG